MGPLVEAASLVLRLMVLPAAHLCLCAAVVGQVVGAAGARPLVQLALVTGVAADLLRGPGSQLPLAGPAWQAASPGVMLALPGNLAGLLPDRPPSLRT